MRLTPAPVAWASSIDAAKNIAAPSKPMFIYFNSEGKQLPIQFQYNSTMQALSRKEAVFVLVNVPKKPSDDEKALLRKYGVTRSGTAILADHNGNFIMRAEERRTKELLTQIEKTRTYIDKIAEDIAARMEKGRAAFEQGNPGVARMHFQTVLRKYSTYDEAKEAAEYLRKLDEKINPAAAYENAPAKAEEAQLPPGIRSEKGIVYMRDGERGLRLDLYRPEGASGPVPLMVWVSDGVWNGGARDLPESAGLLLKRGYAVACIEYRTDRQVIFPAAVENCKAAVSYLRANAAKFGVDPTRFGAWGESAGEYLVALMGTSQGTEVFDTHRITKEASSDVQAVCGKYGAADDPGLGGDAAAADPVTYVDKNDPPFLIVHGGSDRAAQLHAALVNASVESTLYEVDGAARTPLAEKMVAFFDTHLKRK